MFVCVPAWIKSMYSIQDFYCEPKLPMEIIVMNMSGRRKQELSISGSLAGGISPDSMHVSKKIAIDLYVNQDVTNQTVVSDTVSTKHRIIVQNLTLPEESPEWI